MMERATDLLKQKKREEAAQILRSLLSKQFGRTLYLDPPWKSLLRFRSSILLIILAASDEEDKAREEAITALSTVYRKQGYPFCVPFIPSAIFNVNIVSQFIFFMLKAHFRH